jgi:Flp pilus assembly pilin Flp
MLSEIKRFIKEEDGAAGLEYTLLSALVVVVLSAFIVSISGVSERIWTAIDEAFTNADPPSAD